MSIISRASLPANFSDFLESTAANMRLPQPEPQYLFASMALGASLAAAGINAGMGAEMALASNGAPVPSALDRLLRTAEAFPDAVKAVNGFGLGRGDTIKFQRPAFATAGMGYTAASRELGTDTAISTTGQNIAMEEVPIVLKQYIGPGAASTPQPYALWDFDLRYRASKYNLVDEVSAHLSRDYVKFLDTSIRDLFRATTNITYSDDVANVLSMTNGAGHNATLEMILKARKAISDREWQPFNRGRYLLVVPTAFNVQMLGDVDYRELTKAHTAERNLVFGHIGSVQDIDIVECSTLTTYAAGTTVPGDGNAVPASATVYEALMTPTTATRPRSSGRPSTRSRPSTAAPPSACCSRPERGTDHGIFGTQ
jgi:hypothetical protein